MSSSQDNHPTLVLMPTILFDASSSSLAFDFLTSYLIALTSAFSPQRSPLWLLTSAAWGGLGPDPSPIPREPSSSMQHCFRLPSFLRMHSWHTMIQATKLPFASLLWRRSQDPLVTIKPKTIKKILDAMDLALTKARPLAHCRVEIRRVNLRRWLGCFSVSAVRAITIDVSASPPLSRTGFPESGWHSSFPQRP